MGEKPKRKIKLIVAHRPTIADVELHQAKVNMLTFQSIVPPLSRDGKYYKRTENKKIGL